MHFNRDKLLDKSAIIGLNLRDTIKNNLNRNYVKCVEMLSNAFRDKTYNEFT